MLGRFPSDLAGERVNAIFLSGTWLIARVAKLADARDLKSRVLNRTYRFNSGPGHHIFNHLHDHAAARPACFRGLVLVAVLVEKTGVPPLPPDARVPDERRAAANAM